MDSQPDTLDDVSALAWVQEELRKSLDAAHKSLRRTLKDTESTYGSDLDDVEPALLRNARQQLHQGVGVLELVGLPAAASVLRASEALVQRYIAKPHKLDAEAVEAIERASFALLDYLARRLAGKPMSPVALFPQYRALQELNGADRAHPADLWPQDWQWHEIEGIEGSAPRNVDPTLTGEFESAVLALMRKPTTAVTQRLSDLSAGVAAGSARTPGQGHAATLWQLAAAFFQAQSAGLLQADVYTKRLTSRLLAQLRSQQRGEAAAAERLAQDLNFFCAQAADPAHPGDAPRLASVHRAYPLTRDTLPADYHHNQLGRYDPSWIAQARKRVATAKDSWSAVAGGEMHRLNGLIEQFGLVADSLKRLVPGGERLGESLSHAITLTVHSGAAPDPALAMEIATSVLYLEAALEDNAFDHPEQASRVQRLAQRIDAVLGGATPEPLEPWMEELYRRVSDRQTMGSVVQELRAALSESEKLIDHFFRTPSEPAGLIPVPAQLQSMRGVLSVLGLEQASHAVLRMRDDVDALVAAGEEARHQQPLFERLAGNLSALSFLIDLLGVQPQAAKSMFRFDAASGLLVSQLVRRATPLEAAAAPRLEPALIAQAQELQAGASATMPLADLSFELDRLSHEPEVSGQPDLAASLSTAQAALEGSDGFAEGAPQEAAVREQVAEALADFLSTASDPVGLEQPAAVSAPMPLISLTPSAPVEATGLEGDDEMRDIFLEEAREVIETARAALAALHESADDVEQLTTVRRAFHTLKGSSRMVGLKDFGEAGWAGEQLYNAWLASQQPATPELLACTEQMLAYLSGWVVAIAAGNVAGWHSEPVRRVADALRLDGRLIALDHTEPAVVAVPPVVTAAVQAVEHEPVAAAEAAREPSSLVEPMPADPEAAPPIAWALPPASDLDLGAPPSPAASEPTAPPAVAEPEPIPGMDFSFDLGEPPRAAPPQGAEAPQLLSLPEIDLELGPPSAPPAESTESEATPTELGFDRTQTFKLHGDEDVPADAFDEAVITTLDVEFPDLPEDEEPLAAGEATVIEALTPSAEAASAGAVAHDLPPLDDGDASSEFAESTEPEAVLPEASGLAEGGWVEALQPSDAVLSAGPVADLPGEAAFAAGAALPEAANDADGLSASAASDGDGDEEPYNDQVRRVGPLRIGIPLFNIFLNEADELSRRLGTELSEWALELNRPVGESAVALAHSLAGGSATVGFADLSALARQLEHTLARSDRLGSGTPEDAQIFNAVADEVRRLLHQFAAGFLKAPPRALIEQLAALEFDIVRRLEAPSAPPAAPEAAAAKQPEEADAESAFGALGQAEYKPFVPLAEEPQRHAPSMALDSDVDIDQVDEVDPDLFVFFEEEAQDLLPELASHLREWHEQPGQPAHASAAMRTLHTLKGGARLAGAMRLGELSHRLETAIEHLLARESAHAPEIEVLLGRADALSGAFETLRQRDAQAYEAAQAAAEAKAVDTASMPLQLLPLPPLQSLSAPTGDATEPAFAEPTRELPIDEGPAEAEPAPALPPADGIDWSRFAASAGATAPLPPSERAPLASAAAVRVRTQLLDRMVNQAGEVSIARARLESEVGQIKNSLGDLTDNLERLRQQLRDIELQAETQMSTRMEAAKAAAQSFDPLEFDRFTRFQEITRMMAESVNDVATVQRSLQRTLETAEDELASQARLTRDLQDDLLRTRMVEFEGLSERLYRVVRQAAKETGKQVRLDILGGSIEVDRGVLDRMTGAFEHLLRNCVTHGIEPTAERAAAGKDPVGAIVVSLRQEGNEVSVEFRDDGAGLNLLRIRDKAAATGLIDPNGSYSDAELANLIFTPGFTTAEAVTELAGRGVGMDVVRSEVNALGGRIETASAYGQGSSFRLVLPLTTAVTQVVMLRCGQTSVAVPATLVEIVRRAKADDVEAAYASGVFMHGEHALPFFWLGALLQASPRSAEAAARMQPVVVIRSAQQRVVLHVDEVLGNQEVVVKNLGPQLSRLPGLAGMTLLASGAVALIYNPVALATVYADAARRATAAARLADAEQPVRPQAEVAAPATPLVLVVDDSLTVRRVTQRLLVREGYRVMLAKDGLEALERLAEARPSVVLSDIEMPRMDGFDLVRNLRGDSSLASLPVIMITSRIAQKHRDYAVELGVDHYLGKPYSEEELLALIGRYCAMQEAPA